MLLKGMEFDTAHFITDVSGKYPRLWALKGAHPVTVNRWYKFGVLASIRTIAPGFREISELPDWVGRDPAMKKIWREESARFGTMRQKRKDGPSTKNLETNHRTNRRRIWSHAEERKK
ncbi:hypothetical protein ACS0TY_007589 [Phlomoides rotata]